MTEGFLSRWSRRKAGKEKESAVDQQLGLEKTASPAADISSVAPKDPNTQTPLPLTLEDVEKIARFAADFSALMKPDRNSTRLNSSHVPISRTPSSA